MKKNVLFITIFSLFIFWNAYWDLPNLECSSFIWCWEVAEEPLKVIGDFTWEFIKYIAVIAVISVMISGIYYLISMWDDEKVKKAKKWIIWSVVWVLISISAWYIINSINNLSI